MGALPWFSATEIGERAFDRGGDKQIVMANLNRLNYRTRAAPIYSPITQINVCQLNSISGGTRKEGAHVHRIEPYDDGVRRVEKLNVHKLNQINYQHLSSDSRDPPQRNCTWLPTSTCSIQLSSRVCDVRNESVFSGRRIRTRSMHGMRFIHFSKRIVKINAHFHEIVKKIILLTAVSEIFLMRKT